ncbi:putative disease resistance protein RGA3 [Syzygium oleosum]|uniref:putative disease resistance protein RGA3 n=1 Tax=Syzygium oleosum TaxID=219896 RepID=UPI0024BA9E24|nr:putative disease resistance protein RGA3 [Syzygium oleosum]
MAEAVLFNLATDVLELASSIIASEIQLGGGARDELVRLRQTVEKIRAVLLDAEKEQWHDARVKLWLSRLKDVLYDVQDLLDDVVTQNLRGKVNSGDKMSKKVSVFLSKSTHRLKVANKIKEIRKRLDQIANEKDFFHLEPHLSESTIATVRRRMTHSFVRQEEIIGREEDKKEIIAYLFDSSSGESVSVVSIVGIGGIGKTAVAKLVYNDDKVNDCFKLKIWVCVSDVFDEDLIIKGILKSAPALDEFQEDPEMMRNLQDIENKSKDQLQSLLRKVLDGNKYLLVLDDLWNEDRQRWLELRHLLMGGSWGSKILVTTRSHKVAKVTNANSVIHVLRGLSEDKSWNLFRKMAFRDWTESLDPELEEMGRDIVTKCTGVPLAIRTMGYLLYGKKKDIWLRFKVQGFPEIPEIDDGIMQVLKLSYDHLPSQLKHCFAYCALFPKDFVFDKQTMIQLWMAQGFIDSLEGNEDLEETGDSYVSELLSRSFLEVEAVDDYTGEVKMFKIHNLMHDLALKVAGGELEMINRNEDWISGGIRHASFVSQSFPLQKVMSLLEATKLRTFLFLKSRTSVQNLSPKEYNKFLSKLTHCRALDLGFADFYVTPSLGSQLTHIRFLDVSENQSLESLPNSMTDLLNLQTLKLSGCKNL